MSHPIPDFQNTEIAFKHLSNADLYRAWTLFRAISLKPFVTAGPALVTGALKIGIPIKGMLRSTVFRQFCGGETLESCQQTMTRLKEGGVFSILDYGVEGEKTEAGFDAARAEVLKTIHETRTNPLAPFCVFKMSALARFELLETISQSSLRQAPDSLRDEWRRAVQRVEQICAAAIDAGKLVMIDAEETWIQPAIDDVALSMMRKYNAEKPRIYTTIQMYRAAGLSDVKSLMNLATSEGWIPGIKLVRGAYMEKERDRARAHNNPSPIHPDKKSTDEAYDEALKLILNSGSATGLCAGTHNASSSLLAIELMARGAIPPSSPRVWFAQLLGMSDDLTFNLAHAGYHAAKYVPYGPVAAVLPYLFRRARENTSIAGQSGRELLLIERELKRRSLR